MGYLIGVIIFVLGMLISIALHEVGHMVPAKRFGVRVSQYMVGFGPTLWSRQRGETEYGLKAIPLGGYVRLVGMFPPERPGRPGSRLAQEAREVSAQEVRPGEEHRAFYNLSAPKKLVVMLAGPLMNLLIAAVILLGLVVGVGTPQISTTVGEVVPCLPTSTQSECGPGSESSPAQLAGLQPGDKIVAYAGQPIAAWQDFTAQIAAQGAEPTTATVLRAGNRLDLPVTPRLTERPVVDAAGKPQLGPDGAPLVKTATYVGVAPSYQRTRGSARDAWDLAWLQISGTGKVLVQLPVQVWQVGEALFTDAPRSQDSVMSIIGVGRVAGEVGSADGAGPGEVQLLDRVVGWLSLLAALNIALFVFNLIPLLPLDGGHIAGALGEGARRTWARLRKRPLPGPLDTARMMPLAYGVFAVLIGISIILILADVFAPVRLTG